MNIKKLTKLINEKLIKKGDEVTNLIITLKENEVKDLLEEAKND